MVPNSREGNLFDTVLESNKVLSCFQEKPMANTYVTVDKKIIETIIEYLLYLADDDEKTTIEATQNEKLIGFEPILSEDDEI